MFIRRISEGSPDAHTMPEYRVAQDLHPCLPTPIRMPEIRSHGLCAPRAVLLPFPIFKESLWEASN